MSTLMLERSPVFDKGFERDMLRRLDSALLARRADTHGRSTLDELITGVWEGLAVRGSVECPVCGGLMDLRSHGDGDYRQTGSCMGCGSKLC